MLFQKPPGEGELFGCSEHDALCRTITALTTPSASVLHTPPGAAEHPGGTSPQHRPSGSQQSKGQLRDRATEKEHLEELEPGPGGSREQQPQGSYLPQGAMPESFALHVLKVLRELLAFVLFSYTVLLGALLLAGWTTYFLVLK